MAFLLKLFNPKDSSTTNSDARLLRDKFKAYIVISSFLANYLLGVASGGS